MPGTVAQRKDDVMLAAQRLFADRGYHATSVRDIAESLSIQGGSLYTHIESKEDLLWDILNRAADRFFAAAEPIVQSDLIPVEKLRRLIQAHVGVVTSSAEAAAVYTTQWRHLSEPRRSEFAQRRDQYEAMVRDLVHDCVRCGEFADIDEKFGALLILSSINWIYQWYRPEGLMTPEEIARKLTEMLFNGLRRGR